MLRHFGYGEYENAEVEIKQSTWHMRHFFLETLTRIRRDCINDLLRIVNHEIFPPEKQEMLNSDSLTFLFHISLFNHNPQNIDFDTQLFDTPIREFFALLEKKKAN